MVRPFPPVGEHLRAAQRRDLLGPGGVMSQTAETETSSLLAKL
jgi:hypothetical protein